MPSARHELLSSFVSGSFTTAKLQEEPWQVLHACGHVRVRVFGGVCVAADSYAGPIFLQHRDLG